MRPEEADGAIQAVSKDSLLFLREKRAGLGEKHILNVQRCIEFFIK